MCNERERLISYVYDECDAAERRLLDAHLASCPECRAEIGALRRVRQDLLAWDVPYHESIWQPFVTKRIVPSWRDVPVWAMAAAAAVLLLVGGAGGAATYALMPHAAPAVLAAASQPALTPASVSAEDLSALEQRLLTTVRSEMDERVRVVATHAPRPATVQTGANIDDLRSEVQRLKNDQLHSFGLTVNELGQLNRKVAAIQQVAYQPTLIGR